MAGGRPQPNFPLGVSLPRHYDQSMKRGRLQPSAFSLQPLLCGLGLALLANPALALTDDNPYVAIVGRNAFALKPPPRPEDINKPPPPVTSEIKLQGISTILGRKQVIMKVKTPARAPEPAKDLSIMLGEGEREGEIEVLEINAAEGVVRLKNGENPPQTLTMADNSEKPSPGAVPSAGGQPGLPGRPPLPGGVPPPAPAVSPMTAPSGGASVTTFGGTGSSPGSLASTAPTIPTRTLRSSTQSATTQPQRELSVEEGAVLLELNRKMNEGKGLPYPPARFNLNQ